MIFNMSGGAQGKGAVMRIKFGSILSYYGTDNNRVPFYVEGYSKVYTSVGGVTECVLTPEQALPSYNNSGSYQGFGQTAQQLSRTILLNVPTGISAYLYAAEKVYISYLERFSSYSNTTFKPSWKYVELPDLTSISARVFGPNDDYGTSYWGSGWFDWYSVTYPLGNVHTLTIPKCTRIGVDAFAYSPYLYMVSVGGGLSTLYGTPVISSNAFYGCRYLMSLYLMYPSVAALANRSVFMRTPMSDSMYLNGSYRYGSIYVPSSLLSAYKSATNWTYYSNRFVGI